MSNKTLETIERGECHLSVKLKEDISESLLHPSNKQEETLVSEESSVSELFPPSSDKESERARKWFDKIYFPRICVQEFLQIADQLRGGGDTCRFSGRAFGSYNVVVYIIFDDGVEWAIKMPRGSIKDGQEHKFLNSEYATLRHLWEQLPAIPAPRLHSASFTTNNPAKTPYIIMDKVPGVPLWRAVRECEMRGEKVDEMLRQMADVRKALASHTWVETGSLTDLGGEFGVVVNKQLTIRNFFDDWEQIHDRPGAFESSIAYNSNLLQETWRNVQKRDRNSVDTLVQWKIQFYPLVSPPFVCQTTRWRFLFGTHGYEL